MLITKTDILGVIKEISANIDSKKFDRFISEAQEFDLKPVLGPALYLDFVNGLSATPQVQKYADLFNGKTYLDKSINANISFLGIKTALIYYSYSRMINNHDINVTAFGIVHKENEYSVPSEEKRISRIVSAAKQSAEAIKNDCIKFLNDNDTDYPLWKNQCKAQSTVMGGINISRVTKFSREQ